jgi:hypothetical protein
MKAKANDIREFWERLEDILYKRKINLTDICRDRGLNYDTIISNKMRETYPTLYNTSNIAKALNTNVEFLLYGNEYELCVNESPPHYGSDNLTKILNEEPDIKALVWRILQCSAIQLRAIKTMLSSWGIEVYDESGKTKVLV